MRLAPVLVAVLLTCSAAASAESESWATARARSLTRDGDVELAAGHFDTAARRYTDALAIDGSFEPAYLALGAARERTGDVREAERVYTAAVTHLPGFADAFAARARLRHRLGRFDAAEADLDAAIEARPDDVALLEELATWEIALGRYPAALARYRRIKVVLEARDDHAALAKAALKVRALGVLSAETDVVRAAKPDDDRTRRAIAKVARRAGL